MIVRPIIDIYLYADCIYAARIGPENTYFEGACPYASLPNCSLVMMVNPLNQTQSGTHERSSVTIKALPASPVANARWALPSAYATYYPKTIPRLSTEVAFQSFAPVEYRHYYFFWDGESPR